MKKYLTILFCCLSTTVLGQDLELNCQKLKKDAFLLSRIYRCENSEVICYITLGGHSDQITCKWKE
ncbi:MAG: hypothetical protein K2M23_02800 [Alphaproteobacteria bacterium]|nr:hypothetical protein [Alphaproteobacteria bacterium]